MSGLKGDDGEICAACRRPGAVLTAYGDHTVWLHLECQRAYEVEGADGAEQDASARWNFDP